MFYGAIEVKTIPATNTKGTRLKATYEDHAITVSYDHALTLEGNVKAVAVALLNQFGGYVPHNRNAIRAFPLRRGWVVVQCP